MIESTRAEITRPREVRRGVWTDGLTRTPFGSREYRLWIPAVYDAQTQSALIMMLHGCTQHAEDLAAITGMNAVADREGVLLVYPEQSRRANFLKCWNWFEANHQTRGRGEPAILASIVAEVRRRHNIDLERIYVIGVSAGGAMAVVLGATYPDVFSAIAVSAGVEFKAATSRSSAFGLLRHGGPDPVRQGRLAFEAMSAGLREKPRARMPVIVFQGTKDHRVPNRAADQVIAQWAETNARMAGNGVPRLVEQVMEGSVPEGYNFTKSIYQDSAGLLMEKWMIHGLGHAWSGAPEPSRYGDPKGPNASEEFWRFFRETSAVTAQAGSGRNGNQR